MTSAELLDDVKAWLHAGAGPQFFLLIALFLAIAYALWRIGTYRQQTIWKVFAVWIGLLPLLAIGIQVAQFYGVGHNNAYKTSTPGPASREPSVTQEFPFPITDESLIYGLELSPEAKWESQAQGPVTLHAIITSPKGIVLLDQTATVTPAPKDPTRWTSISKEFQTKETGDHLLRLEIPQPVRSVDVAVVEHGPKVE